MVTRYIILCIMYHIVVQTPSIGSHPVIQPSEDSQNLETHSLSFFARCLHPLFQSTITDQNCEWSKAKLRHRRNGDRLSTCSVVISEINADNPGTNRRQFIELERICKDPIRGKAPRDPLPHYKLIIVRAIPLAVVFALDLSDSKITYSNEQKRGRFFVIGSKNVNMVTIDIQSSLAVESVMKSVDDIDLIPTGDDSEYAVILIENESKIVRNQINLYRNPDTNLYEPNFNIKEEFFASIVRTNAKDMVVYGRKVTSESCTFFDNLYPEFLQNQGTSNYFFRDWDPQSSNSDDLSINRCTQSTFGFVPSSFKLGKISPGLENNCDGSMVSFETMVSSPLSQISGNIEMLDICETNDNEIPVKRFKVSEEYFHSYVQSSLADAKTKCANRIENGLAISKPIMDIEITNQLIKRLGYDPLVADYQKHRFTPQWIDQCKKYLPYGSQVLANSDVQSWLDISVHSDKCMFSCFACKFYFKSGFRTDVKHKTNIQTTKGYFSPQVSRNSQQISKHSENSVHIAAKKFLVDMSAAKKAAEFLSAIKTAEETQQKTYLPTIRMVRLVYAEIIAGVAYRKHNVFVDVVKSFEVNLGIHHYHALAAKQITAVISTSFHDTLINYLVSHNLPISVMVDESTDSVNVPYMICYLQALEDGYPIVYLYSLIHLKYGQSATQLFQSFREQIQLDNAINPNFEVYFKNKIVALATDGASVMRGVKNSFWVEMETYLQRKIPSIHCFAHKLELSVKRALITRSQTDPNFVYFKNFEKSINSFYTFYMSRGSKRWLHLVQVGEEIGLQTKRIRYHFDLRWSSSYFSVIKSLHDDLDVLRVDLVAIVGDESFTEEARNTAADLHFKLTDKSYCITIMEYADFLSVYKQISLTLQKSSGLLMGKHDIIQSGINMLLNLQNNPGEFVNNFLSLVSCDRMCEHGTCTLQQYDDCPILIYRKPNKNPEISPVVIPLTKNDPQGILLSEKRNLMYQSLINELKAYFDLDLLESFEVFNPNKYNLPNCAASINEAPGTAHALVDDALLINGFEHKVTHVCTFLRLEDARCKTFIADWKVLMTAILNNVELVKNFKEDDVSLFWPLALTYPTLPWTPITKYIIQTVLVIPFSSSDCERGFRYVTTLKSNERTRLTPANLEHLVRIKVNGPQDINLFQAEKYAELFLQKHVRADDESAAGGRKFKTEKFKSFFRDSRLF